MSEQRTRMSEQRIRWGLSCVLIAVGGALSACASGGGGQGEPVVGRDTSALTAEQCSYFDINGKDLICHATGSAKNPYVLLKVSDAACTTGHAAHPGDYIAVDDPTCSGKGCLPDGAPCDATVPCCGNAKCTNGTCGDPCDGVVCNSPPAPACVDGGTLRTFDNGTCAYGACSYTSTDTSCASGCANGACNADSCSNMNIRFVGVGPSTEVSVNPGTDVYFSLPSFVQPGDLLIVQAVSDNGLSWKLNNWTTPPWGYPLYRIATGTAEDAPPIWHSLYTESVYGNIAVFRGVSNVQPFGGAYSSSGWCGACSQITAPSITTTHACEYVVASAVIGYDGVPASWLPPTGPATSELTATTARIPGWAGDKWWGLGMWGGATNGAGATGDETFNNSGVSGPWSYAAGSMYTLLPSP